LVGDIWIWYLIFGIWLWFSTSSWMKYIWHDQASNNLVSIP
jgi:hypothetical protein